jgi:hypothetical protein
MSRSRIQLHAFASFKHDGMDSLMTESETDQHSYYFFQPARVHQPPAGCKLDIQSPALCNIPAVVLSAFCGWGGFLDLSMF